LRTGMFGGGLRHRLVLPADLALLVKAVAMGASLGEQLDPALGFIAVLAPYARRLVLAEYGPRSLVARLGKEAPDLAWLATELPGHLRRLVGALEAGTVKVAVQPT